MKTDNYSAEPVRQLLTLGMPEWQRWPIYRAIGLSREHIPELIAMLGDEELCNAETDSMEMWAQVHAWRALAQFRAVEAIDSLIAQLRLIDEQDDDWAEMELPKVFAKIGPEAIPALAAYLADPEHGFYARASAAESLKNIGMAWPDDRERCIEAISRELAQHSRNDSTLNGFLVGNLIDLKAVESLGIIQEAYDQDNVDISISDDLESVEIEMGVREPSSTPLLKSSLWDIDEPISPPAIPSSRKLTGRNDPCPCGSGRKYKKCCLNKEPS